MDLHLCDHHPQPLVPRERYPRLITEEDLRSLKNWHTPAEESLWARLQYFSTVLANLPEPAKQASLYAKCLENLSLAKASLRPAKRPFCESFSLYWRLVHQVEEDLLFLVPAESLLSWCEVILELFDREIRDESLRQRWLGGGKHDGLLEQVHKELHGAAELSISRSLGARKVPAPPPMTLRARLHSLLARQRSRARASEQPREQARWSHEQLQRGLLRTALRLVNESRDRHFRQYSFNVLIHNWSALSLLGLLLLIVLLFFVSGGVSDRLQWDISGFEGHTLTLGRFLVLLLLGAAGAYASNIISKEPFLATEGPTRRFFLSYLVAKPVLSAFAALLVYLVVSSHILLSLVDASQVKQVGQDIRGAGLVIMLPEFRDVLFAYAVLAVLSGFAADKMVRSLMDRVFQRIVEQPHQKGGARAAASRRAPVLHHGSWAGGLQRGHPESPDEGEQALWRH